MEYKFNSQPITFLDGLTLLFIGLKLTGHIDWSWVWVLSPLWVPLVFVIVAMVTLAALASRR